MPRPYDTLRLMADDMTGALDSAAGLVSVFGPLAVGIRPGPDCPVLDTATREAAEAEAAQRVAGLASHLAPAPGRLSVFKVDSLLRGHAGAELAAILRAHAFHQVIIAPALPFQRRTTRGGRQGIAGAAGWRETGEDLGARLREAGFTVVNGPPVMGAVTLCDAETDADLDGIVAAGLRLDGPALWVGSGGLTAALGRAMGGGKPPCPILRGPLLGLVGTDHPVMLQQLGSLPDRLVTFIDRTVNEPEPMSGHPALFLRPRLPEGLCRRGAQAEIASLFASLVRQIPRPGALFVSGGETLRGLLLPLGVERLDVLGEWEPGLPVSRLVGGRWPGLTVISKSGAFGTPDLLNRLLASLATQPVDATP